MKALCTTWYKCIKGLINVFFMTSQILSALSMIVVNQVQRLLKIRGRRGAELRVRGADWEAGQHAGWRWDCVWVTVGEPPFKQVQKSWRLLSSSLNPDDSFLTRSYRPQYRSARHQTHIWRIKGCFVSECKSVITSLPFHVWWYDVLTNCSTFHQV